MSKDKIKYYLKLLNLKEDADIISIKTAYRKAAKIHHPDKSDDNNALTFNEIKTAHDVLIKLRQSKSEGSLLVNYQKKTAETQNRPTNQKEKITYHDIIKSKKFWVIFLSIVNIFLIVRIGLNTELTPLTLLISLLAPSFISLLFREKIKEYRCFYVGYLALPFLLTNFFLTTNFLFSSKQQVEFHYFKTNTNSTVQIPRESTLVELNNDAYKPYPGIRLHFDVKPLLFSNAVEFHFETGLFGLRVLKKSIPIFKSK